MSEVTPLLLTPPLPTFLGHPLTTPLAWQLLMLAILSESLGTICMKLSDSFNNFVPSVMIFVFYAVSFTLLPVVMKVIDLSITYAVWSGVGTVVTAMAGFCYFKEPVSVAKVGAIGIILMGVGMLKWIDGEQEKEEEGGGRGDMP